MERTDRIAFFEHRGTRILSVDYSGLRSLEAIAPYAEEASRRMAEEPPGSVLALLNFTGVPYSLRSTRQLGEMAVANAPCIRARALIGVPEAAIPVLRTIAILSGKPLESFPDRGSALEWLAEQAG